MIDTIKEYISVAFYFLIVCNIILRIVFSKKKKKKKKNRKRKGGSIKYISYIFNIFLCLITFGLICPNGSDDKMFGYLDAGSKTHSDHLRNGWNELVYDPSIPSS